MEIQRLITLVSPHIQRATHCNFAHNPEVQLLAVLHFYAMGSFLEVVGDGTGLSKASVSWSVAAVTLILLRDAQTHIKMPTTQDKVHQVHQGFHAVAGIPQVICVVDGTLIPIHNPSLVDPCWIGRKHYAAINTQVVVDQNGSRCRCRLLLWATLLSLPSCGHRALLVGAWGQGTVVEGHPLLGACMSLLRSRMAPLRLHFLRAPCPPEHQCPH